MFQIIETTTKEYLDHHNLARALEKAEELCTQVNEGVRQKENSDRLEWLQTHVQLDGLNDVRDYFIATKRKNMTSCLLFLSFTLKISCFYSMLFQPLRRYRLQTAFIILAVLHRSV